MKKFNNYLTEKFAIAYEFCDGDINKFFLILRKGVNPIHTNTWIAGKNLMNHHHVK